VQEAGADGRSVMQQENHASFDRFGICALCIRLLLLPSAPADCFLPSAAAVCRW